MRNKNEEKKRRGRKIKTEQEKEISILYFPLGKKHEKKTKIQVTKKNSLLFKTQKKKKWSDMMAGPAKAKQW